ncbi:hypothetical protein PGT21_010569 [Puccinia graminis f. sp. tritici]|uniref:Uncharacterized protein n=1 Tax=Puccinia graminis f. sp. tritici TaxID=56615 RepID=A0A5B0MR44_PUCGR|nr:hypothetical protein PGT21_010569 [Puccinia graminis f. sp. tritici]
MCNLIQSTIATLFRCLHLTMANEGYNLRGVPCICSTRQRLYCVRLRLYEFVLRWFDHQVNRREKALSAVIVSLSLQNLPTMVELFHEYLRPLTHRMARNTVLTNSTSTSTISLYSLITGNCNS